MKQTVLRGLCSRTAIFCLAFGIAGAGFGQATPAPAATSAPTPATASSPEAASSMMEPVRQAIANQDYDAASRALQTIRQQDPNNPHIAVYENIIRSRQSQPSSVGLRTPRPGVTPGPTPEATPTPVPTPVATPSAAPVAEAGEEGIAGKATELLKNQNVLYGLMALAALIVLGIIFMVIKKRKAARELEEPIQTSAMGTTSLGGLEDYSGAAGDTGYDALGGAPAGGGLGGVASVPDYTSPTSPAPSAYGETSETPGIGLGTTGALGGAGLAGGGLSGYTVPTFAGEEDEESAPPPPRNLRPTPKPEEDDRPVSLTDDEPQAPATSPLSEPTSPLAEASTGEGLGINFDALSGVEEQGPSLAPPSNFAQPDEETVIVSPAPGGATPTPTATPSVNAGTVDLSDIFGEQAPPQKEVPFSEQPTFIEPAGGAEEKLSPLSGNTDVPFSEQPTLIESDTNSETLPTFVSGPGVENPEEDVQIPPKAQRPVKVEEDETISFEELFGSQGLPAAEPEPVPPAPAAEAEPLSKPSTEISIEDALAATLGAMQAEEPDEQPAPASSAVSESTESLDERSERMFREQMDKARKAFDEKNWRQAVHFLSIASALHPENDEAKQMLKEARAEKRKAEESV